MKNVSKKSVILVLVCALILSLTGCNTRNISDTPITTENSTDIAKITTLQEENTVLTERVESLSKGQDQLKDEISKLEEELTAANLEISRMQSQMDMVSLMLPGPMFEANLTIIEPEHRLWLSTEDCAKYLIYAGTEAYTSLPSGCVLEAYASMRVEDSMYGPAETWLLVHSYHFDAGEIPLSWVKLSECIPYTTANRQDACWPVYIRDGEALKNYPNGADMAENIAFQVHSIKGGIATLSERGWTGTTSVDNLIYPDPFTFSYIS